MTARYTLTASGWSIPPIAAITPIAIHGNDYHSEMRQHVHLQRGDMVDFVIQDNGACRTHVVDHRCARQSEPAPSREITAIPSIVCSIAQGQLEFIPVVTGDSAFSLFDVALIW